MTTDFDSTHEYDPSQDAEWLDLPDVSVTIAPSEKSLEDWICAFPSWCEGLSFRKIIDRQVRVPSGIIDVLALGSGIQWDDSWSPDVSTLYVVELKKGTITHSTVTQCLRYMTDIKKTLQYVIMDIVKPNPLAYFSPPDCVLESAHIYPEIMGVVVGYDVEDENVIHACHAANIVPVTYEYSRVYGHDYFEVCPVWNTDKWETYVKLSKGKIGNVLTEIVLHRDEHFRGWVAQRLEDWGVE